MITVKNFLIQLNSWDKYGSIDLVTNAEDIECMGFAKDLRDKDVAVYYDWSSDEMGDNESAEFYDWLDTVFNQINSGMAKLGYTYIDENDGSGGGLVYGGILYRPITK